MIVFVLSVAAVILQISVSESQIYVYPYGSKIILVEPHEDPLKVESKRCYLYEERSIGSDVMKKSVDIDENTIKLLKCESNDAKIRIKRSADEFFRSLTIFPGTNWCGAGNISDDDEDLGALGRTDNCCRQHDQCFDTINANQTKYGLKNRGLITLSHCDCDDEFYQCLREVNTPVSHSIGKLFFNILRVKCFRKDYPIIGCKKAIGILKRCDEYELDEDKAKKWQMFDPKKYRVPLLGPLDFLF